MSERPTKVPPAWHCLDDFMTTACGVNLMDLPRFDYALSPYDFSSRIQTASPASLNLRCKACCLAEGRGLEMTDG